MIRSALVAAVPLVLVPALGLAQGGFSPDAWVWAGALAAWAAAVAVILSDDGGALRQARPWLLCMAALLAWTIASSIWSVDAAQSRLDARRTLCYAAVLLALVTLTRRGSHVPIVVAVHASIVFVIGYALLRYLLGAHNATEFEGYLLSEPLGYANAAGILAALGALLATGFAAHATSRRRRAAAAATMPLFVLAIELSSSDASWLALAIGTGAALLLDERPSRVVRALLAVAAPCAAVLLLGRRSGFTELATPRIDGWVVVVGAVGCMLLAAAIIDRLPSPVARRRRPPAWLVVAATAVAVGVAVTAIAIRGTSTQPRASYYHVAWHYEYRAHPVLGSGAGTFAWYWIRHGDLITRGGALDVHSLYLESLAELGPVGLVLLLATLLFPLGFAVRERCAPYVPAAASAYVAFLCHAAVDWDWEMPVVVVAALSCAAAVVASSVRERRTLSARARAAVLVPAIALGALAIAGTRSHTVPAASPRKEGPAGAGPTKSGACC
jgi:hypothetical protein